MILQNKICETLANIDKDFKDIDLDKNLKIINNANLYNTYIKDVIEETIMYCFYKLYSLYDNSIKHIIIFTNIFVRKLHITLSNNFTLKDKDITNINDYLNFAIKSNYMLDNIKDTNGNIEKLKKENIVLITILLLILHIHIESQ